MTSDILEQRVGLQNPGPNQSASGSGAANELLKSANGVTVSESLTELTSFLRAGLKTVVEELGRTNDMRAEMASVLSLNLMTMAAAPDPASAGERINTMIGALQSDDRIRQRLEGLAGSLLVMLSAMDEVEQATHRDTHGPVAPARPIRDGWGRALLDSQCLDELSRSFAARLDGSRETS